MSAPASLDRKPGEAVHQAALERFRRLAYTDPAAAYEAYGLTLLASVDEADRAAYLKALGIEDAAAVSGGGGKWDAEFALAVAAHRRGDLDAAEAEYLRLLRQDTTRQEVHYNLGALFLERGNRERALDHLEKFEEWLAGLPRNGFAAHARSLGRDLRRQIAPETAAD